MYTPEQLAQAQNPTVAPATDPMHALIAQLIAGMNQHQQGPDLAGLLQGLHPQQIHRGVGGGEISADNPMGNLGGNPWTNGFFGPQTSSASGPGRDTLAQQSYQASNFRPNVGTVTGVEPGLPFSTPPPQMGPAGVQGMINPMLPPDQRFQDPNWWTAMPKVNPKGWKPGQVAR